MNWGNLHSDKQQYLCRKKYFKLLTKIYIEHLVSLKHSVCLMYPFPVWQYPDRVSEVLKYSSPHLLQADFSVSSSGETYCAVPTNEFARAGKKMERNKPTHTYREANLPLSHPIKTKETPPNKTNQTKPHNNYTNHKIKAIASYVILQRTHRHFISLSIHKMQEPNQSQW